MFHETGMCVGVGVYMHACPLGRGLYFEFCYPSYMHSIITFSLSKWDADSISMALCCSQQGLYITHCECDLLSLLGHRNLLALVLAALTYNLNHGGHFDTAPRNLKSAAAAADVVTAADAASSSIPADAFTPRSAAFRAHLSASATEPQQLPAPVVLQTENGQGSEGQPSGLRIPHGAGLFRQSCPMPNPAAASTSAAALSSRNGGPSMAQVGTAAVAEAVAAVIAGGAAAAGLGAGAHGAVSAGASAGGSGADGGGDDEDDEAWPKLRVKTRLTVLLPSTSQNGAGYVNDGPTLTAAAPSLVPKLSLKKVAQAVMAEAKETASGLPVAWPLTPRRVRRRSSISFSAVLSTVLEGGERHEEWEGKALA